MNVSRAYYGVFWFDAMWTELVIGVDGALVGAYCLHSCVLPDWSVSSVWYKNYSTDRG